MARLHGRAGRLYIDIAGGGSPTPIAFLSKWTADFAVPALDVTAMGDSNVVKVAGLPDVKGTYNGFYDDASSQLYLAAQDGKARGFYLYPNTTTNAQYWYGLGLFDFSVGGGAEEAIIVNGSWNAASTITKIG
ncbi:MAG: hypothetical protein NVSMB4_00540 [Acidimicrobiales bacterium]